MHRVAFGGSFLAFAIAFSLVVGCGGSDGASGDGVGAGEGAAAPAAQTPAPARSARPTAAAPATRTSNLPPHDPDARFDGKTVLEYAEGLGDLNPGRRVEAMAMIAQFGVNGLPVRDRVRAIADSDPEENLRLFAVLLLRDIKDPDAPAVAAAKLLDPEFARSDEVFAGLIEMLREEAKIDDPGLATGVLGLVRSNPDHAARLMILPGLPEKLHGDLTRAVFSAEHGERARRYFIDNLGKLPAIEAREHLEYVVRADLDGAVQLLGRATLPPETRRDLAQAVFEAEHGDQAAAYFVANIATLEFLDDEARMAYLRARRPVAARHAPALQPYLLSVGTEEAMKLALDLLAIHAPSNMFPNKRLPMMIQFVAQGNVDPGKVIGEMLELVTGATDQELIDEYTSYMEALPREVLAAEQRAEEMRISQAIMRQELSPAEAQQVRNRNRTEGLRSERTAAANEVYLAAVMTLMNEGPSEIHRAFGALRLIGFAKQPGVPLAETLGPVYALLGDASAPDIVRGTAGDQLQKSAAALVQRDPETLIAMTTAALWAGADVNATYFPEQILVAAGRQPAHAAAVLDAVSAGAGEDLDRWAVNPAAAVIMQVAPVPSVKGTASIERASIVLGKIFASPAANPGYLKKPYDSSFHRVFASDTNTIDGYIGLLEPFIFAQSPTFLERMNAAQWASSMANPTTGSMAFRSPPEARERWRAFLQRVVETSPNSTYVSFATTGLSQLEAAIKRGW